MLSLTLALTLAATDWSTALPPEAVGSYLPNDGLPVMVVMPGEQVPAAKAQLVAAVEQSMKGPLVMGDSPLGDVSALSDQEAVKAATAYANTVVVLRVFGQPNKPGLAVVSVFSRKGDLLSSFSATMGEPLAKNSTPVAVSTKTIDAISSTIKEDEAGPRSVKRGAARRPVEREMVEQEEEGTGPRVFVTATEPQPGSLHPELHRVARGSLGGYGLIVDGFVCTLPCKQEVALPDLEYYVGGDGVTPSTTFRLSQVGRSGHVDLSVKAGSWGVQFAGMMGAIIGGMVVIGGGALSIAGVTSVRTNYYTGSYTTGDSTMLAGGLLTLLLGGLLTGISIPAIINNRTVVTANGRVL